ncbi:MAG: clostripain-related cysteine peptidase [Anaerolineae bacterium]|jgi:uncharacterized repeat protein (TIGR01451 family)
MRWSGPVAINRLAVMVLALSLMLGTGLAVSQPAVAGPWPDSLGDAVDQAEWTFLVYLDADNNLEQAGIDDFLELSSVGSTSDVSIVVQFDRRDYYADGYGDWTDTRRFYVTSGLAPWGANGTSIGEANMGDPQTLVDFVQWGMANYPAERYAIIIWDHGSGWSRTLAFEQIVKSVASDDTDGDALDMPELRSAMSILSNEGATPLDLVGFDACLMAMAEVDNELIPYAGVRVGSEEEEPWEGWPYTQVLTALTTNPTMSAAQLGMEIVDAYYASHVSGWTQSAVDLGSAYATINAAVDEFAAALISGLDLHLADIAAARYSTQEFGYVTYVDLYDFSEKVNQHVDDATINGAATAVMDALDGAVIREQHGTGWPGAHGVSIYFPESELGYSSTYDGSQGFLQFTADTLWDEWLRSFYAGGAIVGPLTFDGYAVDDDDLGDSSGNDDGFANPGETIELYVALRNQGLGTATGVTATLSTGDTYISGFVSGHSSYTDIPAGGTGLNLDGWSLAIDPATPDGHQVVFCLDPILDDEGRHWTDCFDLTVAITRHVYLPQVIRQDQ